MYFFAERVRYSETDENMRLTPEAVLNYFQDCSTFQSEDIGYGVNRLKEENQYWVLNYWQIVMDRLPVLGEHVRIGTAPYEFKSCLGFRNFLLETEKGEVLSRANTVWTLLDTTGHPARVSPEMAAAYGMEPKLEMEYASRKIAIPKEEIGNWIVYDAIQVRKHHLDTNHHVNNGQYVKMAIDLLPPGLTIREIRAEYKKSAVLDDIIIPKLILENQVYSITLSDENNQPYAIVQLFCNN